MPPCPVVIFMCFLIHQGFAYQLQQYSRAPNAYDFLQYMAKTIDSRLQSNGEAMGDEPGTVGENEFDATHNVNKRPFEMLSDPCDEVVRHERLFNLQNKKGDRRDFAPGFGVDIYKCQNPDSACDGLRVPTRGQKAICKERMGWILARVWNPEGNTNTISYEVVGPVPRGCFCSVQSGVVPMLP